MLQTNTKLSANEVAHAYKNLWRVERTFREQKSTLEPPALTRDDRSVGHIVAFLALRLLGRTWQRRLDERVWRHPGPT